MDKETIEKLKQWQDDFIKHTGKLIKECEKLYGKVGKVQEDKKGVK